MNEITKYKRGVSCKIKLRMCCTKLILENIGKEDISSRWILTFSYITTVEKQARAHTHCTTSRAARDVTMRQASDLIKKRLFCARCPIADQ